MSSHECSLQSIAEWLKSLLQFESIYVARFVLVKAEDGMGGTYSSGRWQEKKETSREEETDKKKKHKKGEDEKTGEEQREQKRQRST